ncbi:MAG TPA: AI-2E family transporter [Steroidobacteraceae bacterium]
MPASALAPIVLAIAAAALLLHELQIILLPFVIAAVTAYVCTPLVERLTAHTRLPRWLAALTVLVALMAAVALLGFVGVPPLARQVRAVSADLHGAVADFLRALMGPHSFPLLGSTLDAERLADLAVGGLQRGINGAQFMDLLRWLAAASFGFMLMWVLMGYFLIDSHAIASGVLSLVPPRARPHLSRIWHELDPLLRRYFIGVALVVAYATAAAYLGLGLVLGLHHALILALLTGLLEIIPMVGPVAAAVMAGLVAVQQAATSSDIWAYVGYAIALRLSIDQLIGPLVLGNAARVHPVVVIFCFLAGGALFGVVGMILAVPSALLVKVTLSVLYRDAR